MPVKEMPFSIQNIIFELEKIYPYFKKMDIYSTVSNAYQDVSTLFPTHNRDEVDTVKNIAVSELNMQIF